MDGLAATLANSFRTYRYARLAALIATSSSQTHFALYGVVLLAYVHYEHGRRSARGLLRGRRHFTEDAPPCRGERMVPRYTPMTPPEPTNDALQRTGLRLSLSYTP